MFLTMLHPAGYMLPCGVQHRRCAVLMAIAKNCRQDTELTDIFHFTACFMVYKILELFFFKYAQLKKRGKYILCLRFRVPRLFQLTSHSTPQLATFTYLFLLK